MRKNPPKKINLLVASNSLLSRKGLRNLLSSHPDFKILKEAITEAEAVRFALKSHPDILMLCFHLLLDSEENLIKKIKKKSPGLKMVVFNASFTGEQEARLAKMGIEGIFSADCPAETLVRELRKVSEGRISLKQEVLNLLMGFRLTSRKSATAWKLSRPLTPQETKILSLVAAGMGNQEMASLLNISEHTLKCHIQNIFKKMNINNRLQARLFVQEYGLPDAPQ
jgi:DNA-binding NarL/FixJ family response regulator